MYIKTEAELIYVGQGVASNGSPVELRQTKTVKVNEMETFSANYYNEQQRNMRQSRNLVVPTYMTLDMEIDGKMYELMYVNYHGRNYKVRNILKLRGTRQQMILDIQEIR